MRFALFLTVFAGLPLCLLSQSPILWDNPSFEDEPQYSHPPRAWFYCDEAGESPPDVHPGGFFNVSHRAYDGRTYLGMVVRDNGTTEGVGQHLSEPMLAGQCYLLQYFAARSLTYESTSRRTGELALFDTPVQLRLWGGTHNCEKTKLLAQSEAVEFQEWTTYELTFQANASYTHLFLEAGHVDESRFYNGNILLDQLSPILPVDCHSGMVQTTITQELEVSSPPIPIEWVEKQLEEMLAQVKPDVQGRIPKGVVAQPGGKYMQANPELWQIGCLLRYHPELRIELGVSGRFDRKATDHIQRQIWYSLQASGLPASQFRIKAHVRGSRWKGRGFIRYKLQ